MAIDKLVLRLAVGCTEDRAYSLDKLLVNIDIQRKMPRGNDMLLSM
ncbi:hypothetical protein J43TS3_03610 [Ornithinibacillus bavariensis]|uniref:Uncharacterized protein n=1 Tax=Ornithinibacillus bavariensis TaxID=545502 RepID=A0A920C4L2_9BACI|nr:hypothetical protein J43TS3_03610 [Ornithinibacillus bavariensis]